MHDVGEHKQTETDLLAAVESVMQDTTWPSQKIVKRFATLKRGNKASEQVPEVSALLGRLRADLALVAQGLPDDEIAGKLGITRRITCPRSTAGLASASAVPSSSGRGNAVWERLPSHSQSARKRRRENYFSAEFITA